LNVFRILHASDLHLAATPYALGSWSSAGLRMLAGLPRRGGISPARLAKLTNLFRQGTHDPDVLRSFARFAAFNHAALDALIITGDLANTGGRRDLLASYEFCTEPAILNTYMTSKGAPSLSIWIDPEDRRLDLLPGNHDRYRSAPLLPGGKNFDRIFSGFWTSGQGVEAGVSITKGTAELQVFKADFTLERTDMGKLHFVLPGWFGQGRVRRAVLDQLVIKTREWRERSVQAGRKPVAVWAIHFDPFSTDGALQLLGSESLMQASGDAGVTAILCGHTHERKVKPLTPTTTIYACGTTSQSGTPHNDCQVLEFHVADDNAEISKTLVTWHRYDDITGNFLPLATVTR
jgi:hypothetical protein